MEYLGLIEKYKINRILNLEEQELKFNIKNKLNIELFYQLNIIKINSIFIELSDKYYSWKGLITSVTLFLMIGIVFFIGSLGYSLFYPNEKQLMTGMGKMWFGFSVLFILASPLFIACVWLFRKESFRWTHYPIRLNRKNRMVYVFRLDGTVLSVPWDEVFFTLGRGGKFMGIESWDLRAHVLDKDRKTVLETFAFGYTSTTQDNVRALWEYLRRYMEDGPKEPYDLLEYCLPIDQKKEPRLLGLQCLWLDLNGQPFFQILLIPAFLFTWLGRQFAMATCKIPVWPDEVEAACAIEPGDPYVKDGRTNPPDSGLWFP